MLSIAVVDDNSDLNWLGKIEKINNEFILRRETETERLQEIIKSCETEVKNLLTELCKTSDVEVYLYARLDSYLNQSRKVSFDLLISDKVGVWGVRYRKSLLEFLSFDENAETLVSQKTCLIVFSGDRETSAEKVKITNQIGEDLYSGWAVKSDSEVVGKILKVIEEKKKDPSKCPKITPPVVQPFSALKHRIAHCFLSIDVDLQGVNETLEEKQIENAVVYLWDILKAKENSYYRKKLNFVRFLVTGEESFRKLAEVTETKDKILSNGKLVWDLLKYSCSEKSDVMREWSTIEILLGINHEGTAKDVRFMACESMIGKFFDKLDDLIPKYRKLENESEIREKAKEYIQDVKEVSNPAWEEAAKEKDIFDKINDFHGWFTALDRALDKLRGNLPT